MTQTTQDKTGVMFPNGGSPIWDTDFPNGDRPVGANHGAYLTVNATGLIVSSFGTKAQQTPVIWEQFKNGVEGQNVSDYDPTWVPYVSTGAKITSTNARGAGSKSAYNNPAAVHPFATNYKKYTPTDTVFVSYWAYIQNWTLDKDGGVLKLSRITSSTNSGGGGVYNGVGGSSLGGGSPITGSLNGYASFSDANDVTVTSPYSFEYPITGWVRFAYELKLSTVGNNDGFFSVRLNNSAYWSNDNYNTRNIGTVWSAGTYNSGDKVYMTKPAGSNSGVNHTFRCTANGTTVAPFDGAGNVQSGWSLMGRQNYLEDTVLLGLEQANPWYWWKAQSYTPSTVYSLTINGVTCSYTSGAGIPTDPEIVNGILADAVAKGAVARVKGNTWIAGDGIATVTASGNMAKDPSAMPMMMNTDIYLDTSLSRFEVHSTNVYSNASNKLDTQPYVKWVGTQAILVLNCPHITGDKFLFFIDNNRTVYSLGQIPETGVMNV